MPDSAKFFLYTRKSTDVEDRQVYSIEHQFAELRQLAARKGIAVVAEFTENRSAKYPGRPVFNEMIARIKKGEASGIIAWHPDRLSRNPIDGGQIMHLVDEKIITHLEFSVFWFEPTPQGNLMLSIAFGMSKYYTDALSQNIKRAFRQRVQNGYWPRRPATGYRFDRNTRMIVPEPNVAPLIRKTFELYATGEYTLDRLQKTMTTLGLTSPCKNRLGKPITRNKYLTMLTNPIYAGMLRYDGELFEGKHDPIVTQRLFDTCQLIRIQRGKDRAPTLKPFLYRGMFKCGACAGTITVEFQKGHTYLRCTKRNGPCTQPYLRHEEVAKQVAKILRTIILPHALVDRMITQLELERKQETNAWLIEAKSIKTKIVAFDAKFQRLTDAYVDGSVPVAEYNLTKVKLLTHKRLWAEKLTAVETSRQSSIEPAIQFIRGLTEARIVAEGNNVTKQRDLLQKVCSNLFLKQKRVVCEARGAWKHVVELGRFADCPNNVLPAFASGAQRVPGCEAPPEGIEQHLKIVRVFFRDNPAWV